MSTLHVPDHAQFTAVLNRAAERAPDAFGDGYLRNLYAGQWHDVGDLSMMVTPVDGTETVALSKVGPEVGAEAVAAAADAHKTWASTPLAERIARVTAAVAALADARDDLALLLGWEIGKPWRLACADVDRALDGVRWYLQEIEQMMSVDVHGHPFARQPLPGPVSNIASWNYPMSVQVHAELVQLLAGNAVVAKTPTQGGAITLTLAHSLMAAEGLPVTLLSGDGSTLSDALVRSSSLGALAFVGGRSNGGRVAAQLVDTGKRHMLEQEGLNTWGIWNYSDWDALAAHLKKGYEYGKQRCTAYPRFVIQRDLVDSFLAVYLPMVSSLKVGHPLAVADDADPLPELDFGPVISAAKAAELKGKVDEALHWGATPLYRGKLDPAKFIDGQDTSAYAAPAALLAPPGASRLMHEEPFGPVDTIVVVDTEAELLAQMNASNGALVASIACDDQALAGELAEHIQAFKVGINKPRSRGDREEPFGGRGASWKGAFVGGACLVQAVTQGPPFEQLYGNFPGYSRYPAGI
jgi:acyl-CoA reductase-like NAD-dependent aldehyde dehydrogenase